ncbi:LPXTG cell wall anchor domain-containing protein [Brevibacterium sp. 68QC2CO]|nr:LPXTG cell wall anchor domain-containing protein [Brevibacterium sp. 68QC2CO]
MGGAVTLGTSSALAVGDEAGKNCGAPAGQPGELTNDGHYYYATCADGATVTIPMKVKIGQPLHIEGRGFTSKKGEPSFIAQKYDEGGGYRPTKKPLDPDGLETLPTDTMDAFLANEDGSWSHDFELLTADNNKKKVVWEVGKKHTINLLTGSIVDSDNIRGVRVEFEIVSEMPDDWPAPNWPKPEPSTGPSTDAPTSPAPSQNPSSEPTESTKPDPKAVLTIDPKVIGTDEFVNKDAVQPTQTPSSAPTNDKAPGKTEPAGEATTSAGETDPAGGGSKVLPKAQAAAAEKSTADASDTESAAAEKVPGVLVTLTEQKPGDTVTYDVVSPDGKKALSKAVSVGKDKTASWNIFGVLSAEKTADDLVGKYGVNVTAGGKYYTDTFEVVKGKTPSKVEAKFSLTPETLGTDDFVNQDKGVSAELTEQESGTSVTYTVKGPKAVKPSKAKKIDVGTDGVAKWSIFGNNPATPEAYVGTYTVNVTAGGKTYKGKFEVVGDEVVGDDETDGTDGTNGSDGSGDAGGDDPQAGGETETGGDLPRTGMELTAAGVGLALLFIGGVAVILARRRKRQ